MRIALIGGSPLAVATAEILIKQNHEVIIIERDRDKIGELSQTLDCGFIHGDGTKPAILREIGVGQTDVLLCLTNNDQANILASVVGRSLGLPRVVTKIEDPEFEHICLELGLTDTIVPDRTIARTLADMVAGEERPELSPILKGDARFFSFVVREEDARPLKEIDLPARTRVVCVNRDDDFMLPDDGTTLRQGDEVVLITDDSNLPTLRERWSAEAAR